MRTTRVWILILCGLLLVCFGFAADLDTWFQNWGGNRTKSSDVLSVLLGDGRRIFARHFFVKADAYFHSGYYPTVFDNREAFKTPHMAEDAGAMAGQNQGDENSFLGKPQDWIDAFSRQFYPSVHTHLDQAQPHTHAPGSGDLGESSEVREILPWLKISAAFDPDRVETYTVTAYWLRQRMGKVDEAEAFLREGLKANPDSFEILYELGRVCEENRNDPIRARNLWEAAFAKWQKYELPKEDPDRFLASQILCRLATVEKKLGHYHEARVYMKAWQHWSPFPDEVQKRIDELESDVAAATASNLKNSEKGNIHE